MVRSAGTEEASFRDPRRTQRHQMNGGEARHLSRVVHRTPRIAQAHHPVRHTTHSSQCLHRTYQQLWDRSARANQPAEQKSHTRWEKQKRMVDQCKRVSARSVWFCYTGCPLGHPAPNAPPRPRRSPSASANQTPQQQKMAYTVGEKKGGWRDNANESASSHVPSPCVWFRDTARSHR